jgi:tetratricopeptide (TPR) repeat protein
MIYKSELFFILTCRTLILLLLTFIGSINAFAQDSICNIELIGGFGFNPIDSNEQARTILNEVMVAAGVDPKTIGIRAAKVKNATACEDRESKKRYILFNPEWLNDLGKSTKTDLVARAILAHEVGHHKKAHWIQLQAPDFCAPELEAQADEVAGEALAKLKATLEEVQSAYRAIVRETNDGCYPSKARRLDAVKTGWEKIKAIELMKLYESKNSLEEYIVDENVNKQIYYAGVVIRYENVDKQYFDPIAYLFRARAYYEGRDKAPEAIADLNEYLKYNPSDSDVYILIAEYNVFAEDFNAAIRILNKAISINPTSAKVYTVRGVVFYENNKYDLALADLNKAIELDSNLSVAYFNRGLVYEKQGNLDAALADLNKAIELEPKASLLYELRGAALKKKGNLEGALADYTKAIELDPYSIKAYKGRAEIYRAQDKTALAEVDEKTATSLSSDFTLQVLKANKLIENNPKSDDLYGYRGFLFLLAGKLDEALADFTKAIELNPKFYLYARRASIFEIKGNLEGALADYTKAIELNPEDEHSYLERAKIYRALGKTALAEADEKTAKELHDIYK